ncbi:MAG: hypothetical protein HUK12_02445 [Muribaculaceae bacterium]|nr:hypothetical protein [Muribaculaceae bacterium]
MTEDKENNNPSENPATPNAPVGFRAVFGVIIVFIYLAMGILTLCGFFTWLAPWAKYGLGVIFIVYGLWRGYRYLKNRR